MLGVTGPTGPVTFLVSVEAWTLLKINQDRAVIHKLFEGEWLVWIIITSSNISKKNF